MREDDSEATKARIVAWHLLKAAKAAMENLHDELIQQEPNSTHAAKLEKWLATVSAAADDVSNLMTESVPSKTMLEIRQVAGKLRNPGQRKMDDIAKTLERAHAQLLQ